MRDGRLERFWLRTGGDRRRLVEVVENAGLSVLLTKPLFARVVWLVVAMKPLCRLTSEGER